jgi:hypothetical protein
MTTFHALLLLALAIILAVILLVRRDRRERDLERRALARAVATLAHQRDCAPAGRLASESHFGGASGRGEG